MKKGTLTCSVCGRARDEQGNCPTPQACEKFKRPHQRLAREQKAARDRAAAAAREERYIGVSRPALPADIRPEPYPWAKAG